MNAVKQHADASRAPLAVPTENVAQVPHADAAANDDTAIPARTFELGKDPLFGMAIASVILFAVFGALMASF